MISNEEEYGFFEEIDNGDIIVSYSKEDLPNYNNNHDNSRKKKRDSYDSSETDCVMDTYNDFTRRTRIRTFYCIKYGYPFIIVGSIISLFGWILYCY